MSKPEMKVVSISYVHGQYMIIAEEYVSFTYMFPEIYENMYDLEDNLQSLFLIQYWTNYP